MEPVTQGHGAFSSEAQNAVWALQRVRHFRSKDQDKVRGNSKQFRSFQGLIIGLSYIEGFS